MSRPRAGPSGAGFVPVFGFLASGGSSAAGVLPGAGPQAGAEDAEAMGDAFAGFDRPDRPGCAAGALRGGEFVFRGAYAKATSTAGSRSTPIRAVTRA